MFLKFMTLCVIDTPLCTQFLCAKIGNVKAVPSPEFLQHRLKSAGIQPKNLLIDVTNYICLDLGRPMHAYDANKIKGQLRACQLENNDTLLETLDGQKITLNTADIVICDDTGVLGLAGIMGGMSSAVCDHTTSIVLELALFDAVSIAKSGQHHNILSNARTRFERGVDGNMAVTAMEKAIDLITTYSGGTVAETDFKILPTISVTIEFDPSLMVQKTGLDVPQAEIIDILTRLGCACINNNQYISVTVPSWRHDLKRGEDLVEEVLRIKGYDKLPTASLPAKTPCVDTGFKPVNLSHLGLTECLTFSFTTYDKAKLFDQNVVEINNPISQDLSTMKPSLLCGLLDTTKHNLNYGQEHCALYEVGKYYTLHKEAKTLAGLRCGVLNDRIWHTPTRSVDTFDAKGDCLAVLDAYGIHPSQIQLSRDVPSYYHPHQSGAFKQGKKVLAYFGTIHPRILKAYDIKKPCVGFEIFLEELPQQKFKVKPYTAYDLPKTRLDLSFFVDAQQEIDPLCRIIEKTALVQDVSVFDVYTGPGTPDGKKAIAIQFIVQPQDKTLTDVEIQILMQGIIDSISKQFNAQLRAHAF